MQIAGKDARFAQIPILTEQTTGTSRYFTEIWGRT
jgi:hypothetical protein